MVASRVGNGYSGLNGRDMGPSDSDRFIAQTDHEPKRVLVVDDHSLVRAGLRDILGLHEWLVVVGEAVDGRDGLMQARRLQPDVMVVDINLPKLSGLALIRTVRSECPGTNCLVFSMHRPEQIALALIESGARGYVCKTASGTELIAGLERVAAGDSYFDPEFSQTLMSHYSRDRTQPDYGMSPREREVLIGLAEGLSNKQIAARLDIGVRTVDTHRERLVRKLNIRNVAQLTRFAIEHGLVGVAD